MHGMSSAAWKALKLLYVQSLRVTSGDQIVAVKWLLPSDGAQVTAFTAEVDLVSRKGRAAALELDGLFLMQHLTSRFMNQVGRGNFTQTCQYRLIVSISVDRDVSQMQSLACRRNGVTGSLSLTGHIGFSVANY